MTTKNEHPTYTEYDLGARSVRVSPPGPLPPLERVVRIAAIAPGRFGNPAKYYRLFHWPDWSLVLDDHSLTTVAAAVARVRADLPQYTHYAFGGVIRPLQPTKAAQDPDDPPPDDAPLEAPVVRRTKAEALALLRDAFYADHDKEGVFAMFADLWDRQPPAEPPADPPPKPVSLDAAVSLLRAALDTTDEPIHDTYTIIEAFKSGWHKEAGGKG